MLRVTKTFLLSWPDTYNATHQNGTSSVFATVSACVRALLGTGVVAAGQNVSPSSTDTATRFSASLRSGPASAATQLLDLLQNSKRPNCGTGHTRAKAPQGITHSHSAPYPLSTPLYRPNINTIHINFGIKFQRATEERLQAMLSQENKVCINPEICKQPKPCQNDPSNPRSIRRRRVTMNSPFPTQIYSNNR